MPRAIDRLDRRVIAAWRRRLKWATVADVRIDSLGEFFAVIDAFLKPAQEFWFRGHGDSSWVLVPSALRYLRLGARVRANGCLTLALHPVIGTRRILVQKGAFTFHGSRCFWLEKNHAPGLMIIPIFCGAKRALRLELQRIGVDRMTLFPEPEHLSRELRERRGL
jgi:hypothetical protein